MHRLVHALICRTKNHALLLLQANISPEVYYRAVQFPKLGRSEIHSAESMTSCNTMNTYIYLYSSMLVLMHAQQELNEQ